MFENLAISRYRFTLRITEPLRFPDYAGSTLRGVFGHALMQLSGINQDDIARKTPLVLNSPYTQIFAPQANAVGQTTLNGLRQLPVPYVIEAPLTSKKIWLAGELLQFHQVLTEPALSLLQVVILAWRRAFSRGVGVGDGKAVLLSVESELPTGEWCEIYNETESRIREHATLLIVPDYQHTTDVQVQLQTPLRLQQQGKILGTQEISARIFLRHLIRRISLYLQHQNQNECSLDSIRHLNSLVDQVQDERHLEWQDWQRYSSRQKKSMKLGGVVGRWDLKNVPPELLRFIYVGQWLHLGKETALAWVSTPGKMKSGNIHLQLNCHNRRIIMFHTQVCLVSSQALPICCHFLTSI